MEVNRTSIILIVLAASFSIGTLQAMATAGYGGGSFGGYPGPYYPPSNSTHGGAPGSSGFSCVISLGYGHYLYTHFPYIKGLCLPPTK